MRIMGGTLRGRSLTIPSSNVRPTTGRSREAIFSMASARMDFDGARVLDLFAGSGALGLEAISRGAATCTLVDVSPESIDCIAENVSALGVGDECTVVMDDAERFLLDQVLDFDLVLADPPYAAERLDVIVHLVIEKNPAALFFLEHSSEWDFSEHPCLEKVKRYGRSHVSLFDARESAEPTQDE